MPRPTFGRDSAPATLFRVKAETALARGEDLLELAGQSTQARLSELPSSA